MAEHACHLHRHLDGATVTETDDLVIADSGLSDDTFNIVAAARFTATSAPTRVAETLQALVPPDSHSHGGLALPVLQIIWHITSRNPV